MHSEPEGIALLEPADIDVVILCGGLGTRLQSIVSDRPKPLATIHDKPFLEILIHQFSQQGFKRYILCTGHKGHMIEQYFDELNLPIEIQISQENTPLGTAGAIKLAEPLIQSPTFIVTNGDSYSDVNLGAFVKKHQTRNSLISIVLATSDDPKDCGTVTLDSEGRITQFNEKTKTTQPAHINAGIYLFQKIILNYIPPNQKYSLEYNLFPHLLTTIPNCHGHINHNPIYDIGTPERLQKAQELVQTLY